MASCVPHLSLSGGSQSHHVKSNGLSTITKLNSVCKTSALTIHKKSNRIHKFSVSAGYRDGSRSGSSGDFIAGFLLGGALFGTVAYLFAPQIRRSILNEDEDEYGFKKPQQPTYYDEGLEKTRETLNKKIGQLNSAIDNVSLRLRGREKNTSSSNVPAETDPEVEATT
ncbi:hypothetical protein AALP_AA8G175100 [Arabis alpina]|uniref:Low-density receptor-like protein n=1 Tax=Arabis alpina TaxID=50452 RepID=A0A087G7N5_ARAAL|nr:hypothetical protein AALP_AA8G175100 [Arabis alpina]